jgi:putative transferase (TIGR04331 family)
MFLITTADQRFWKIDQPVLFLGEWCRLYAQKALWQKMEHEVLAYHWDDRKKLFTDYQYLQDLYERTLALLADRLNVIHGEDHPIRYWRIIIGPWLLFFIQVFYDRFCSIEQAGRSGKVTGTLIGQYGRGDWVAKDFNDFFFWIIGDAYNYFLYSWIIERLKVLPYEYCDTRDRLIPSEGEGKKKSWGKFLVKDLILAYEKFFPHRLNKYVFISSYLSSMDQWRLQLSLGQWPSLFAPVVEVPTGEVKLEMRDGLSLPSSDKLFEDLLFQIIPAQVPSAYLEQYSSLKERSSAGYPSTPRLILTGNDFYANEGFKFFSAEQAQRGAKIVGVQHGGLYGQALWHAGEELETSVSDVFFTWGWDSPDMPRAKPLAAAKLNRFRKGISPDPKGKVVLALCSMPRYSYHLYLLT